MVTEGTSGSFDSSSVAALPRPRSGLVRFFGVSQSGEIHAVALFDCMASFVESAATEMPSKIAAMSSQANILATNIPSQGSMT